MTASVVHLSHTIKGDDSSMPTQFHHIIAVRHLMEPLWVTSCNRRKRHDECSVSDCVQFGSSSSFLQVFE